MRKGVILVFHITYTRHSVDYYIYRSSAMKESIIQKIIRLKLSQLGAKMFRVNVGRGWTGDTLIKRPKHWTALIGPKDIVIRNARPFSSGVPKGYSDLTGWLEVTITPDMVGKKIAQFVAGEVKSKNGRATKEQKLFLSVVKDSGGKAGILRSEKDCVDLID